MRHWTTQHPGSGTGGRLATTSAYKGALTGKPSLQHVFWHSGGSFLASFPQRFLHFMVFVSFFSHFLIFTVHVSSSLRPPQLTPSCGADGGASGGADGGSGLHEPQVFLHFCSLAGL